MTSIQSIQRQLQSNIRDLQHYIAKYKSLSEDGYSIANKLVNLDIQKRNVLSSTGLKLDPPKQVAEIKILLDKLEKLFTTMVTSISRMKKIQESLETLLFDACNNLGTDSVYSTKIFKSCTFEYLHDQTKAIVAMYCNDLLLKSQVMENLHSTSTYTFPDSFIQDAQSTDGSRSALKMTIAQTEPQSKEEWVKALSGWLYNVGVDEHREREYNEVVEFELGSGSSKEDIEESVP